MKKNLYIVILITLFIGIFYNYYEEESSYKVVSYSGDNLRISIDGVSSSFLPSSGNYYLVDYDCNNMNTKITWDRTNYKLNISNKNKNAGVSCYLEFKSNPLLSEMPVGSYVKYEGDNGCEGYHCKGYNANFESDSRMGFCNNSNYQFYVNGWRIGYIEDGSAVLISAGAPECMCTSSAGNPSNSSCSSSLSSTNLSNHYDNMKNIALKYCNSAFIKNGMCNSSSIENGYVKVMDANVFSKIIGSTLSSSSCFGKYSDKSCGYTNDLVDNGGYYWFGTSYSSSSNVFYWNPYNRIVAYNNSNNVNGIRPVLSLQSSIIVVGGNGTYENPYEIDDYYFVINDGNWNLNSSADLSNVELSLNVTDVVSKVCISVNTSSCSNYVDYSETYNLDLSGESDGEKTIYVYFKDINNKIVDIMQRNILIDRVAPSNNSVTFNESDGTFRTLNISSTGADYMCFSNSSNDINECTDWIDYSTSYSWTFEEGTGDKILYAFFKDEAGNTASTTARTTCTNGCYYKYFMDATNNNYIYLIRNDGATSLTTTSSKQQWYTEGSQAMNVCGAYNRSTNAYIWCIGNDNNAYYKKTYSDTSWTKVNVSSYIDTSTYTYSIVPYSTNYAYLIRSDGKINRLGTSGLQVSSATWTYGYATDMLKCSSTYVSSSSIIVACIGEDGYYHYRDDYDTTTEYIKSSSSLQIASPLDNNSWIDMFSTTHTDIIQTDGSNMYNYHFNYSSSPSWITSNIPGGGVKTCTSGGSTSNNYCIGNDNKLYYKSNSATTWFSTSVTID